MTHHKRLSILAQKFAEETAENYGGKGKFELPPNHKAFLMVSPGGSSCQTCEYVDEENHSCSNEYYQEWNGGSSKLPPGSLSNMCSDWWNPKD